MQRQVLLKGREGSRLGAKKEPKEEPRGFRVEGRVD